ncbi:MAG: response regulator [Burkholderiaceae bacterium]|nr:response regulator [Burkholderiaceae bacterium]
MQAADSERILVVEDDEAIRELLRINLSHAGYGLRLCERVDEARILLAQESFHLAMLDWMLPDESGIELIQSIRRHPETMRLPIIMLTARNQEADRIAGLEAGADDYLSKPFSMAELIARVRAVIRRAQPDIARERLELDGLCLEPEALRVSIHGSTLVLSPTEFRLLHCFMRRVDRMIMRSQLIAEVWEHQPYIDERTVDVHVRRLRLALKPFGYDRLIETVRGGGYRLAPHANQGIGLTPTLGAV